MSPSLELAPLLDALGLRGCALLAQLSTCWCGLLREHRSSVTAVLLGGPSYAPPIVSSWGKYECDACGVEDLEMHIVAKHYPSLRTISIAKQPSWLQSFTRPSTKRLLPNDEDEDGDSPVEGVGDDSNEGDSDSDWEFNADARVSYRREELSSRRRWTTALVELARGCPLLEWLELPYHRYCSEAALLEVFRCCKELQCLRLPSCAARVALNKARSFPLLTEAVFMAMARSKLCELDVSHDILCGISCLPDSNSALALQKIDLTHTDATDQTLYALAAVCPRLTEIHLNGLSISDTAVATLAQACCSLRIVTLIHSSVGSRAVEAIGQNCPQMEHLALASTNFVDPQAAEGHIDALLVYDRTRLRSSSNRTIAISENALLALAAGCPMLRRLDFGDLAEVTDRALLALAHRCPHLRTLRVESSLISEEARVAAQCANRHLALVHDANDQKVHFSLQSRDGSTLHIGLPAAAKVHAALEVLAHATGVSTSTFRLMWDGNRVPDSNALCSDLRDASGFFQEFHAKFYDNRFHFEVMYAQGDFEIDTDRGWYSTTDTEYYRPG